MSVLDDELRAAAADADSGDRAAVERALAVLWPPMVRYCRARIPDGPDAESDSEELARRACLAVVRQLPAVARAKHPHREVYRILRRVAATARVEFGGPDAGLLQDLDPTAREVVLLRIIDGLSAYDTAGLLELPVGRVLVVQHEAMQTLRAQVA
ncbi:siderophore-interacting protein [Rhodococcus sp. NPDC058521]|uniref:siderophore-interacting protein n=1 Tax=Rhodococcus sp. NPDC058521 TaxID=3346536 RepID=UPI00364B18A4